MPTTSAVSQSRAITTYTFILVSFLLAGALKPLMASGAGALVCHVADDDGAGAIAFLTP